MLELTPPWFLYTYWTTIMQHETCWGVLSPRLQHVLMDILSILLTQRHSQLKSPGIDEVSNNRVLSGRQLSSHDSEI